MGTQKLGRYRVSGSAGGPKGKPYAVIDTQDQQDGKGLRRVAHYPTAAKARAAARTLNAANETPAEAEVTRDTDMSPSDQRAQAKHERERRATGA